MYAIRSYYASETRAPLYFCARITSYNVCYTKLLRNLTVAENISINQMLESNQQTVSWKTIQDSARKALDEIGEKIDLNERVENLSMAKKQIIA